MCTSRLAPTNAHNRSGFFVTIHAPSAEPLGVPLQNDLVLPQRRAKCFGQLETVRRQSVESRCLARSAAVPAQRLPYVALIPLRNGVW